MAFNPESFELANFQDDSLDPQYLAYLINEQPVGSAARYGRLWDYFRNELLPAGANGGRSYVQAQEAGLPCRITGAGRGGEDRGGDGRRKEVVVENDIAWRIHTMIDFLFGRAPSIRSLARDPGLASAIESVTAALLEANGSVGFLQELALLGSIYGFVDIALRIPAHRSDASAPPLPQRQTDLPAAGTTSSPAAGGPGTPLGTPSTASLARALRLAGQIAMEPIEAPRVLPILDEDDYRRVHYWIQFYRKRPPRLETDRRGLLGLLGLRREVSPKSVEALEIVGRWWWQRYEDGLLVDEGRNFLGRLPVVHVQNVTLPNSYEGLGDVEPLVPLQDELNTRLSDRANRVTYQSFKMYLGKGIDDFLERPVGPGQMWATHNLQASIEEFGADSGSPSEDAHIEQVRAALDKVSGVTPLAAGLIRGNIGNLTSATALKVLLGGLLAKTAKKRLTYGAGLAQIVDLTLTYLDQCGALRTEPADRRIEIHWPNPLPADEGEQLRNAQIKASLGLPVERVLAELGYDRQAAAT